MKSVVIVGGGVIGLSCAVRLAKAGARVTLLEGRDEGVGVWGPTVSASAAGMLAAIGDDASPHDALALRSFDLWRAQRDGAAWADAVRFDGAVVVHANAEAASAFIAHAGGLGREAQALSPSQFSKRTNLRAKAAHAVFVADEGTIDPVRALTGLAMEARAHGALVRFAADVHAATAHTVTLSDGEALEADAVVLAPGVWAEERLTVNAPALRHVRPARGCLIPVVLEKPLAPNLRTPGFYMAQRLADVVLGSSLEYDRTDRRVDPAQVQRLLDAANGLFPGEIRPGAGSWTGLRPMAPDGWPMIGPTGEGVLVAAGHSRNGWLLAPITAEIVTAYVTGAEISPQWAALSPARFETP
jgi:glycine oxidase